VTADNERLDLTPEQMRAFGYRVIDVIVEHLSTQREQGVGHCLPVEPLVETAPPEQGAPFETVLEEALDQALRQTMHVNHPRFFAYVPSPSNYVSVLADTLSAAFNTFAGTWISGSGAAVIERTTVDWLRQLCGFPAGSGGLFVSGGSMANLTALATARSVMLNDDTNDAVVYFSDQTHSAVTKSLRVLGFRPDQLRAIRSDHQLRLPVSELARRVDEDANGGRRPFCVVANAGTTNTGAVDPLGEVARFCRERGMWMHVDGAYGAAAVITSRGRELLAGMDEADSLALDPHKWLFQPFEVGCVIVRNGALLRDTFEIVPEYLRDTHRKEGELNLADYGVQLTRSFRALKLWMSLRFFGLSAFRSAVERGFRAAEFAEACMRERKGWVVESRAQMGIVCFRLADGDNAFHERLVQTIVSDGYGLVTSTVLAGRTVLRMCTINPRSTEEDIRSTIERIDHLAKSVAT